MAAEPSESELGGSISTLRAAARKEGGADGK